MPSAEVARAAAATGLAPREDALEVGARARGAKETVAVAPMEEGALAVATVGARVGEETAAGVVEGVGVHEEGRTAAARAAWVAGAHPGSNRCNRSREPTTRRNLRSQKRRCRTASAARQARWLRASMCWRCTWTGRTCTSSSTRRGGAGGAGAATASAVRAAGAAVEAVHAAASLAAGQWEDTAAAAMARVARGQEAEVAEVARAGALAAGVTGREHTRLLDSFRLRVTSCHRDRRASRAAGGPLDTGRGS